MPKTTNRVEILTFCLDEDEVKVHISDLPEGFSFRIEVNGDISPAFGYHDLASHKGWYVTSAYYEGSFREFVPFRLEYANVHFKDLTPNNSRGTAG